MNKIFFYLFLYLYIFNIIVQACPNGYYAISGGSCLQNNLQIKNSQCIEMFSNFLGTPTQGDLCVNRGYSTLRGGLTTVSNSQFNWSYCASSNLAWIFYWVFGSCDSGDETRAVSTYTVTSTNKYFIVVNCYTFVLSTFLIEMSSVNTASQGLIDQCLAMSSGRVDGIEVFDFTPYMTCPDGYTGSPCVDINECTAGTSGCDHICFNSAGSYSCGCNGGYTLNVNGRSCDDVNECTAGTSGCAHNCINSIGLYSCSCNNGFELDVNGKTCSDINECIRNTDNCEDPSTCNNLNGSFNCTCNNVPGYKLGLDGKSCVDINECNEETHLCVGVSTCFNTIGSYQCICPKDYNPTTDQKDCVKSGISSPLISLFIQKSNTKNTFIVKGDYFVINNSQVKIGIIDCLYLSGDNNTIECRTSDGLEVIGDVIVTSNSLVSYPYAFIGSPYIVNSTKPSTQGGLITITGRNFPIQGTLSLTINSINCPIESNTVNEIQCIISEGSGNLNSIILSNGTVTNTDNSNLSYDNPSITSVSHVYNTGGVLAITGINFGISTIKSKPTVSIGKNQCNNIEIKNHTLLTCELNSSNQVYSNIIDLSINGIKVSNVVYFEYSKLEIGQCECNQNGECTSFGCVCSNGFTGTTCNETLIELIPISNPDSNTPTIDIGNSGLNKHSDVNGFGYKISITSIQELDFTNDKIIKSYDLLKENWQSNINSNQWIFNKTLDNKCYLECEFKYFKQSKNITFANNTFTIPSESLKLSFKTENWPFQSKLNSLRIIVSTNTLILSPDVNECSIDKSITTSNYNDHLWTLTENSESGIIARFVKYATVDDISIIAKIETLESNDKTISLVGISIPYFSKSSTIDPDFSVLLNVDKDTGNCSNKDNGSININWKVATGVTIGVVSTVAIAGSSFYYFKLRKSQTIFLNLFKK